MENICPELKNKFAVTADLRLLANLYLFVCEVNIKLL